MAFKRGKNSKKKSKTVDKVRPVKNRNRKLAPGHVKFGLGLDPERVLAIGDSLRAEWNFYPDGRIWIQQDTWFDAAVGQTIVRFKRNDTPVKGYAPSRVQSCLFPNGERGLAVAGCYPDDSNKVVWRRPSSDRGHWWPGSVKFSPPDAIFTDYGDLLPIEQITKDEVGSEMPNNMIPWTEFFNACTRSEILKSKLRIDTYAWGFWGLFIDHDVVKKSSNKKVYFSSDRVIGEILARLRGCGERYTDFYFGHEDGLGPQPTQYEKRELLFLFDKLGFETD